MRDEARQVRGTPGRTRSAKSRDTVRRGRGTPGRTRFAKSRERCTPGTRNAREQDSPSRGTPGTRNVGPGRGMSAALVLFPGPAHLVPGVPYPATWRILFSPTFLVLDILRPATWRISFSPTFLVLDTSSSDLADLVLSDVPRPRRTSSRALADLLFPTRCVRLKDTKFSGWGCTKRVENGTHAQAPPVGPGKGPCAYARGSGRRYAGDQVRQVRGMSGRTRTAKSRDEGRQARGVSGDKNHGTRYARYEERRNKICQVLGRGTPGRGKLERTRSAKSRDEAHRGRGTLEKKKRVAGSTERGVPVSRGGAGGPLAGPSQARSTPGRSKRDSAGKHRRKQRRAGHALVGPQAPRPGQIWKRRGASLHGHSLLAPLLKRLHHTTEKTGPHGTLRESRCEQGPSPASSGPFRDTGRVAHSTGRTESTRSRTTSQQRRQKTTSAQAGET